MSGEGALTGAAGLQATKELLFLLPLKAESFPSSLLAEATALKILFRVSFQGNSEICGIALAFPMLFAILQDTKECVENPRDCNLCF